MTVYKGSRNQIMAIAMELHRNGARFEGRRIDDKPRSVIYVRTSSESHILAIVNGAHRGILTYREALDLIKVEFIQ